MTYKTHGTKDDYVTYVMNPLTYEMVYLNMQDIVEQGVEKYQFSKNCEEMGFGKVLETIHYQQDYLRSYCEMIRDVLVDISPEVFGGIKGLAYWDCSMETRSKNTIGDISKYQIFQDGDDRGLDIHFLNRNADGYFHVYVGASLIDDIELMQKTVHDQLSVYHIKKQEFIQKFDEQARQERLNQYLELFDEFGMQPLQENSTQ